MFMRLIALASFALATAPLAAQATGPQGLAEPKAPVAKTAKVKQPKGPRVGLGPADAAPHAPPPPAVPANIMNVQLSSGGTVSILTRPDKAPLAVERLKTLAARGFYNGLTFHRVIDGFMAQGGDPKGDGTGGSDLPDLKAEFNDLPHVRGALAMARAAGDDSANSQFYLVTSPTLQLDGHYTVAGRVIQGMAYVDLIEKGEPPANPTKMVRVWFGAPPSDPATPATASVAAGTAAVQTSPDPDHLTAHANADAAANAKPVGLTKRRQ